MSFFLSLGKRLKSEREEEPGKCELKAERIREEACKEL